MGGGRQQHGISELASVSDAHDEARQERDYARDNWGKKRRNDGRENAS
jgi:hypothetical protein